jgi:hypothetical protein
MHQQSPSEKIESKAYSEFGGHDYLEPGLAEDFFARKHSHLIA